MAERFRKSLQIIQHTTEEKYTEVARAAFNLLLDIAQVVLGVLIIIRSCKQSQRQNDPSTVFKMIWAIVSCVLVSTISAGM